MCCSLTHSQFWPQEKQRVWLLFHTISGNLAHILPDSFSLGIIPGSRCVCVSGSRVAVQLCDIRGGECTAGRVLWSGFDTDAAINLSYVRARCVGQSYDCLSLSLSLFILSVVLSGLCSNDCPEKVKVSSDLFFSFMQDTELEWKWHAFGITRPTCNLFPQISEEFKHPSFTVCYTFPFYCLFVYWVFWIKQVYFSLLNLSWFQLCYFPAKSKHQLWKKLLNLLMIPQKN